MLFMVCNFCAVLDIDECATGLHSCHGNAHCTNTMGSYTCRCQKSYIGNGKSCSYAPGKGLFTVKSKQGCPIHFSQLKVSKDFMNSQILLCNMKMLQNFILKMWIVLWFAGRICLLRYNVGIFTSLNLLLGQFGQILNTQILKYLFKEH